MALAPGATQAEFEKGGAPVFTRLLTGVRDRFYFRPDANGREVETAHALVGMLREAVALLQTVRPQPPTAGRPPEVSAAAARRQPSGELRAYTQAAPRPPPLRLAGLDGATHDLAALRGRVVLVNFWRRGARGACTSCPLCNACGSAWPSGRSRSSR